MEREDKIKVDWINKYFLIMADGFTLLKIVFAGALLCCRIPQSV
jgi:hypothetical protein